MTYQPTPTTPIPTGATSIELHTTKPPRLGNVRAAYDETFAGYRPPEWTLDAECSRPGTDPELFYPSRGGNKGFVAERRKQALAICGRCIVRDECLEDAIAFETGEKGGDQVRPEVHGIRGGMTHHDRAQLIYRRNVEEHDQLKAKVIADYAEGKLTVREIAAKHGVSKGSIPIWAKAAGVTPRQQGGGSNKGQRSKDSQRHILGHGRRGGAA